MEGKQEKTSMKENIKAVLFFTAFVLGMLYVGYEFGTMLNGRIHRKHELDSLNRVNLELDIELKKKKLGQ